MESLEHRRVVVMGLGRFGGGVGVTRWLASQGADVLVTDRQPQERLDESVSAISDLVSSGIAELRLGEHRVSDFTTADLIVVNPAVPRPWEDRFVRSALAGGIPVTTEIGLVCERLDRRRVIGITGSAGKSTVCSMVHAGLASAGIDAVLGGNIGGSVLNQIDAIGKNAWVVLELSSAMLHWLGESGWSPAVAGVTNLESNHLDWHGSERHYAESKQRILSAQVPGDRAVLGAGVAGWMTGTGVERIIVTDESALEGCAAPGRHNAWNGAMALALCRATGLEPDDERFVLGIRAFGGLAHRLSLVHEQGGVRFYDDSKSTVPKASELAVQAIEETIGGRVHLICGGYDKGVPLDGLAALATRCAALYTVGKTGDAIAELAGDRAVRCGTLDVAVREACGRSEPGDAVLLSPGCASWDQFDNFQARGLAFASFARSAQIGCGS